MQQRATPTDPAFIDYGLLAPLFLHSFLVQATQSLLRITVSYRAVELGLSEVWVGIIAGVFALLPVFIAVGVGRYVDGGKDARAAMIGSWLFLVACLGFRLSDASAPYLVVLMSILGVGHLYLMVAHQMLSVRASSDATRESVFGTYMVATALGQGVGPLMVGWVGGAARIPPTRFLFGIAVVMTLVTLVVATFIRPPPPRAASGARAEITPVPELLRTPGLPTLMLASVIVVTAQDLIVIYMPLLGAERGIDVANVGWLLMVRSATAVISRIFYAPIIRTVGRVPLTALTMLFSSVAFVLIALPLPLPVLYVSMVVIGFGLGIAATLSISNVVDIVPIPARGVALSLRITGNRIGQMAMPVAAGAVAAAAGAAGIFYVIAFSLAASGASVHIVRNDNRKGGNA